MSRTDLLAEFRFRITHDPASWGGRYEKITPRQQSRGYDRERLVNVTLTETSLSRLNVVGTPGIPWVALRVDTREKGARGSLLSGHQKVSQCPCQ